MQTIKKSKRFKSQCKLYIYMTEKTDTRNIAKYLEFSTRIRVEKDNHENVRWTLISIQPKDRRAQQASNFLVSHVNSRPRKQCKV